MGEIKEISTYCPFCERMMEIPVSEILLDQRYARANGGPVMVSHQKGDHPCCRVSIINNVADVLKMSEPDLLGYILKMNEEAGENWLTCIKPTSFETTIEPSGCNTKGGLDFYQPPLGASMTGPHPDGYLRREYMRAFAYDPGCAQAKKPSLLPVPLGNMALMKPEAKPVYTGR